MQESKRTDEQLHMTEGQETRAAAPPGAHAVLHRDQEESYHKSLELIYSVFRKGRLSQTQAGSGNALYDMVALVCRHEGIAVASYERVCASCGEEFGVADIARLSHCAARAVRVPERWYRMDVGPFLAFDRESGAPVALLPTGPGRYAAYRSGEEQGVRVDAAFAATLSTEAWTLCRPFPNRVIHGRDLMRFGFRHVYQSDIVGLLVLTLVGTLIGLLIPWLNQQLYDELIPLSVRNGIIGVGGIVLACGIGNVCFSIVRNLFQFRSMSAMKYAVQAAAYDRLFQLPEEVLSRYGAADLAQRASSVGDIYNLITNTVVSTVLTAVFSLLYLWRMNLYSPLLSVTSCGMLAVVVVYIVVQGLHQRQLEREMLSYRVQSQTVIHQLLAGIAKIRVAGVENRAEYEYLQPYVELHRRDVRKAFYQRRIDMVTVGAPLVFSMVQYLMIVRGGVELSMGAFMGFTTAFSAFQAAMLQLTNAVLTADQILPLYDHCRPILENVPEYEDDAMLPGELTGEVDIDNVSFSYDADAEDVLHQVSLHVAPGEYVGIVGSSGSGKSTLLRLLLGFERPRLGAIYYDGRDMEHLDKRELRGRLGVVLQNGGLIPGSILDNIRIMAPDASMERVEEVLREVGLDRDIAEMPMGVHTMLSENDGMISGGQRQRILIGRAIVNRPRILLLDEATSALDNVTQAQVVESLDQLHATRIVIAHRLSTVMHCDRILVMEHGRFVEEGTYEELMERKGRFYQLALRQVI